MTTRAERVYHRLLRLLPDAQRREAEPDLLDVFRADHARIAGMTGAARFWIRIILDTLVLAVAERRSSDSRAGFVYPTRTFGLWLEGWGSDAWHAVRRLRRAPAFSGAVFITLTLGLGTATTVFSAAYAIWLKPLPYTDADRLVTLRDAYRGGFGAYVSVAELDDYRMVAAFQGVAAYSYGAALTKIAQEPVRVLAFRTSIGLFPLLGARPALGRLFVDADLSGDAAPVVLLSDAFWRTRFGADPAIVGERLDLLGSRTVVGVMPSAFRFPDQSPSDVWIPLDPRNEPTDRSSRTVLAIARLSGSATLEHARNEMALVAKRLEAAYPASNAGWSVVVTSFVEETLGGYRPAFASLLSAVCLLLLVGCSNVASLFLARNASRQRDLCVQTALGASRSRLRRQVLVEALLISGVGGLGGVLLACVGSSLLAAMLPLGTPRLDQIRIDWPTMGFAVTGATFAGGLCGLVPALCLSTVVPGRRLAEGNRTVASGRHHRLQNGLVVAEVALSFVLLVGAGLMARSFLTLVNRDRGFSPNEVLTMHLTLPVGRYGSPDARVLAFQDLVDRLHRLPDVQAAGLATGYPGGWHGYLGSAPIRADPRGSGASVSTVVRAASPDYFTVMQVPLRAGRIFTDRDRTGAEDVLIANATFASRVWPGQNAIGKTISMPPGVGTVDAGTALRVVGVVGDMQLGPLASPEIFVAMYQVPTSWADVVVRTSRVSDSQLAAVRQVVRSIEPDALVEGAQPMGQLLSSYFAWPRTQSVIVGLFGLLTAFLAAVGLHGLLAYVVSERFDEIGVRLALGATRRNLFNMVVVRGMTLTAIGLGVGAGAASAVVWFARGQVFGLGTVEPSIFVAAAGFVMAAAFVTCFMPARCATQVDPVSILRH